MISDTLSTSLTSLSANKPLPISTTISKQKEKLQLSDLPFAGHRHPTLPPYLPLDHNTRILQGGLRRRDAREGEGTSRKYLRLVARVPHPIIRAAGGEKEMGVRKTRRATHVQSSVSTQQLRAFRPTFFHLRSPRTELDLYANLVSRKPGKKHAH